MIIGKLTIAIYVSLPQGYPDGPSRPSYCSLGSTAAAGQPLASDLGWSLHAALGARWAGYVWGLGDGEPVVFYVCYVNWIGEVRNVRILT